MSTQNVTKERTNTEIKEPKRYNVIMHNDDFTTMDFVVKILTDIFHKDKITARKIMMDVHLKGRGVVGSYSFDIATTKVRTAMSWAKAEGFPFRMTVEEV